MRSSFQDGGARQVEGRPQQRRIPMAQPSIHSVPHEDRWANEREGASRASAVFDTQEEAIEDAKRTAQRENLEHVIHGRDGEIRERSSYGNDPFPPRG
jgi:uncharacterized protein DUF2188